VRPDGRLLEPHDDAQRFSSVTSSQNSSSDVRRANSRPSTWRTVDEPTEQVAGGVQLGVEITPGGVHVVRMAGR
jgi:hypothetical protein